MRMESGQRNIVDIFSAKVGEKKKEKEKAHCKETRTGKGKRAHGHNLAKSDKQMHCMVDLQFVF